MATADIAALVQRLVPSAEYRLSGTYAELAATWTDVRTIPTEGELEAVRTEVEGYLDDILNEPSHMEKLDAILNQDTDPDTFNDVKALTAAAAAARTAMNID